MDNRLQVSFFNRTFIFCLSLSSDNSYLAAGLSDSSIHVWHLNKKTLLSKLQGHEKAVNSIVITNDNTFLVSGSSDFTIRIWSLSENIQKSILTGHESALTSLLLTKDNKKLISSSYDETIRIWDFINKSLISSLKGHSDPIKCLALNHNDSFLLSGSSDKTIKIWNLQISQEQCTLLGHKSEVISLTIWNTNNLALSGSCDNTIIVWDLDNFIVKYIVDVGNSMANCLEVFDDGKSVVIGSYDKSIRILKGEELQSEVGRFEGEEFSVLSLKIANDRKFLYTGSAGGVVKIWNIFDCRTESRFMCFEYDKVQEWVRKYCEMRKFFGKSYDLEAEVNI